MSTSSEQDTRWEQYFTAAGATEYRRLREGEASFDEVSIGNLERLDIRPGHRCLEVGAGAGSIAQWMADRAGAENVVATDLDPRFLEPLREAGVTVARQDLSTDEPPSTGFDVIHARNVLLHVAQRHEILPRMVTWLRPGGWLLVEEGFWRPRNSPYQPIQRVVGALVDFITKTVGSDFGWAGSLPLYLEDAGLTEVGTQGFMYAARAGAAATNVVSRTVDQLAEAMLAAGTVTDQDLAEYRALIQDPRYLDYNGNSLIAAWGRR